uniref:MADF domain-containing protein n=1 Tax=Mola mola TaxID=94237 RepID=A0A3Q3WQC5_MOLML
MTLRKWLVFFCLCISSEVNIVQVFAKKTGLKAPSHFLLPSVSCGGDERSVAVCRRNYFAAERMRNKMNNVEKKLANLIREHPNLYDQSRQDYKDTVKGHVSWTRIAEGMEKTEEEVKLKWKNLRDKFCKNKIWKCVIHLFKVMLPSGSSEELEREREKDEKHAPRPVVSNSFSFVESSPSLHQEMGVALKRKRQTTPTESEIMSADALSSSLRDEDELFLLSLLPSIKRLTIKKRMEVRMKFQQVLYAAEPSLQPPSVAACLWVFLPSVFCLKAALLG